MDSASSTLQFSAREGSPPVEDDGAMSVAAGLAKEAALLFQSGKFLDCLRVLNQLLQKKPDDPKVRHNIAIAESFQDGCKDPRSLIKALEKIKKHAEELAHAPGENLDVSSTNGSNPAAGVMGNNKAGHESLNSSVVYSDEFDTSVTVFNIAVVWFHLHEYAKSFSCLDTLYQNIEPVDEGTALRICLLLLDVALLLHHASRSADVISYMEKVFCINSLTNQLDNGTSAPQQSLAVSKSTLLPTNSTIPDASHSDPIGTANTLENSLTRTLSEEALDDEPLPLLSSLDISGQNIQRSAGIASSKEFPRGQTEESLSAIDLRLKLHVFKIRFLLLTRNFKAAKREIKLAMVARGNDNPMALYLKSQLEYARGNHNKAIKILLASSNHMETGLSSTFYNDLGCIYYQLGKHHTSGVCFSRALSNSSLVRKEKSTKLVTFSQDNSLLITYNCGVHSLACGRPIHAARCFQTASQFFYNRPLLWLRIAECCLMALEKRLIKSVSSASVGSDIEVDVIGQGKWRRLALRCGTSPNGLSEDTRGDDAFPSNVKQPNLSLSHARQCLLNALYLLGSSEAKYSGSGSPLSAEENELGETPISQNTNHRNVAAGDTKAPNVASGSSQVNSNGDVKEQKVGNNQNTSLHNSIPDYEKFCLKENHMLKQAALADLAYVELALGNPLKALSIVKSLLKLPDCSRIYMFLGNMYAAEALCLLNRPKEAAEHLMMYISGGNDMELPYSQEDCEKWKVEKVIDNEETNGGPIIPDESQGCVFPKPEEARGILCANYAAYYALMGDLERADYYVTKALSDMPNRSQAILTAIYVDLKRNKREVALAKLKQHKGVRFLPGGLALKPSSS